jgi:hypothetical protein
MGSDVQNSELAIGEFAGNGSISHANSEFGTSEPVRDRNIRRRSACHARFVPRKMNAW